MQNSQFDEVDFLFYEHLCDKFLHSPHGHLVLLADGVIAHLAYEVISFNKVYDGPADNVKKDGMFISKVKGGSGYYSNVLSEAEVNLVLDVYHVDTSELISINKFHPLLIIFQGKEVTSSRPSSFLDGQRNLTCLCSGLDIGHSCENWFHTLLQKYKTPGLKTLQITQEWKDALKLDLKVQKVFDHHKALLGQLLGQHSTVNL